MKEKWIKIREGNILGVVDSYGAVHSEITETVAFHEEYFKKNHCQWRWDFDKGIWWITMEAKPDEEQLAAIQIHLNKKYGIKFWDNGFHDIDFILKKCGKKQNKDGIWVDKE